MDLLSNPALASILVYYVLPSVAVGSVLWVVLSTIRRKKARRTEVVAMVEELKGYGFKTSRDELSEELAHVPAELSSLAAYREIGCHQVYTTETGFTASLDNPLYQQYADAPIKKYP